MDLSAGYREWAPPAALRHVLSCLWSQVTPDGSGRPGRPEAPEGPRAAGGPGAAGRPGRPGGPGAAGGSDGGGRSSLVLPDGCSDLMWVRGGRAFVAGPDTGPVPTELGPGTVIVGARFRPGAGGSVLGVPLSELLDQRVDLVDLRRDMDRRLPGTLEPDEAVARITDVAGRLAMAGPPDRAVLRACGLLGRPGARTGDVAAAVGLSGRQLLRRCEAAVGYGPKTLQRVLRFRRFVSLVDASAGTGGPADLARAALDSGYADQPHLTRETVRLAGLPPAALVRERLPR